MQNETQRHTLGPDEPPFDCPTGELDATANCTARGGTPWGFWPTLGFGVLILAVWSVAQALVFAVLNGPRLKAGDAIHQGWIMAWATIVGAPIAVGAAILLAHLRKGIGIAAYLGLAWPGARQAIRWSSILLGLIAASDLLTLALGRPVVPEPMIVMFRTAGSMPLLLLALFVAAPLAEEFLFRGFLLAGFLNSRLGPIGAIAVTATAWASIHVQYDLYGMVTIAASGLLLGLIRWRTGSLWLCALLHGLINVIATVEVMVVI
jgi:membrane protease YdiL (CAAX protease family)